MKKKFRKNQVIEIFEDQQTCTKSLGKVKLIEYLRPGATYFLPDDDTVWCYERWIVEFVNGYFKPGYRKQHNIRFNFRDIEPDPKVFLHYPETLRKIKVNISDDEEHDFLNDYNED